MRRQAFTLVELLVSVALIVLIMSILSQAFVEGLGVFRQLKGIGDLQENLRSAVVPLREDLISHLFDASRKLSDPVPDAPAPWQPKEGFFRIVQLAPAQIEGTDGDGLPATTATNHLLHFTIKNVGARRADWFSAPIPPGTPLDQSGPSAYRQSAGQLLSQWAEVAWFLVPMNQNAGTGNTPLFTLHRRRRVLLDFNNSLMNNAVIGPPGMQVLNTNRIAAAQLNNYPEVCCLIDPADARYLRFPSPAEVADPNFRSLSSPVPIGTPPEDPTLQGQDRVISDVISFEVKILRPGSAAFTDIFLDPVYNPSGTVAVYDTATAPRDHITIKAIQVIIRVWDYKTEQARQITMIQDM
jgi:prepilin-type N-terminal cleavage/methylation domain-containing protein